MTQLFVLSQTFHKIFQAFGLQIAITKTEVHFQRPKTQPDLPDPQIFIDSTQLQVVNKFKYLGKVILTAMQLSTKKYSLESREQMHLLQNIIREFGRKSI